MLDFASQTIFNIMNASVWTAYLHTHVHVLTDCERRLAPSMTYITLVILRPIWHWHTSYIEGIGVTAHALSASEYVTTTGLTTFPTYGLHASH